MTTVSQDWYYRDFARTSPVQGPFTLDELAERAQTGELAHDALVRCGDGEWLQADQITELILALRQRRRPGYQYENVTKIAPADRRRLNWIGLFALAIFLGVIAGVLVVIGLSNPWLVFLVLLGQLVSVVASVIFLCAIIRWAIEPLFAKLVDNNERLSEIAKLLKEQDRESK